jgi:hypothetical protein
MDGNRRIRVAMGWIACSVLGICGHPAGAELLMTFNNNTTYSDSQVHVYFYGGALDATNVDGGAAIGYQTSYSFHELKDGIHVTSASGRAYFTINGSFAQGIVPEAFNPSGTGYNTRFDKVELFYGPPAPSVTNLTSVDFFSFPIEARTYASAADYTNHVPAETLSMKNGATTKSIITGLQSLVGSDTTSYRKNSSGDFVRFLSGSQAQAGVYPDLSGYVDHARTWASTHGGTVANLHNSYGGITGATEDRFKQQDYTFSAHLDASNNLTLTGSGDVIGAGWTITIKNDGPNGTDTDYVANQIYLQNPTYTASKSGETSVTETVGSNSVFSTAVRDIVAGFGFGFVASDKVHDGTAIGELTSAQWMLLDEARTGALLFAGARDDGKLYYNQYAEWIAQNYDGYGQPFSDFTRKVFDDLTTTYQVEYTVHLPLGEDIPEPASLLLLAVGVPLLARRRRGR